jgi:hypothetical protein
MISPALGAAMWMPNTSLSLATCSTSLAMQVVPSWLSWATVHSKGWKLDITQSTLSAPYLAMAASSVSPTVPSSRGVKTVVAILE